MSSGVSNFLGKLIFLNEVEKLPTTSYFFAIFKRLNDFASFELRRNYFFYTILNDAKVALIDVFYCLTVLCRGGYHASVGGATASKRATASLDDTLNESSDRSSFLVRNDLIFSAIYSCIFFR